MRISSYILLLAWAFGFSGGSPAWGLPAAAPLRLSGTFIQYQPELAAWPPETWRAVLDQMKGLKMNTIILQMLVQENGDGSLRSFIGPAGIPDATETILDYADAYGFRVFIGLYLPNWNHDMTSGSFLTSAQTQMAAVAQQAWDRYLVGDRHRSFAGWYLPYESWTGDYQPDEIARLRGFFQGVRASCRVVSREASLAISPFISSSRPPPCQVEAIYTQLLSNSGIDLVLLQDSVGAQQWESNIVQRVTPYFEAMQNACKAAGVQFWANVESFKINGGVFGPCAAARLKQQMAAVAPFVDGMVTFDFVHYMNTAAFLSSWNAARRTAMKQLYADYLHGCVEADYTPFAAPSLNACLDGKGLTLKWRGLSGDQFQADFKTNLAQLDWTPVNTPVWAADSEFSLNEVAPPGPQGSYFRVQRLPRLQPPDTLLFVPPGNFQMGTPTNELNRTPVELKPFSVTFTQGFWIGQFEVTQSEYQNVACTNPAPLSGDLEYPAANVSWSNAVSYCELLTRRERQAGRLPAGYAYRLPTEAEWEYAARAGSTNRFGFGDDLSLLSAYAWFSGNSHGAAHAVGQLQPNLWGLNDIQGNVAEWCLDWINPAPTGPVTDYRGSITNSMHAIRGGAWSLSGTTCRLGWRSGVSAAARSPEIGFRIVLAPADP